MVVAYRWWYRHQMRCYEPELPVADFNIDGAPAEGTGEKEGAHSFPRRKSYRKRKSRLGQEFLDLNIRQLETVRGRLCEDDGPIRYADNVAQGRGTRKLHIAVGNDGHSVVTSLRSVVERIAQKLELIMHQPPLPEFWDHSAWHHFLCARGLLPGAQRDRVVGLNLQGDGFRTLLWFEVVTGVDEKLCNRLRGVHPLP